MEREYKAPFARFVKKAHKPLALAIEDAVDDIADNPEIGEEKKGDLAGVRVYKFKHNRQEYLVAYRLEGDVLIIFYMVDVHENFYDELKRYIRETER